MIKIKAVLIFFIIIFYNICIGQTKQIDVTLKWKAIEKIELSEGIQLKRLSFDGCNFPDNTLPYFKLSDNLPLNSNNAQVKITNAIYIPLTDEENLICKDYRLTSDITPKVDVFKDRMQNKMIVTFPTIKKNLETGKMQKLISFKLETHFSNELKNIVKSTRSASNSVLSSGSWYKVGLNADGVYKITYSDLQSLGINPQTINPKNIRIYNNGGGMLPESNDVAVNDDLYENAIYVSGEEDGVFNTDDYILFYGQSTTRIFYNSSTNLFSHALNLYSDVNYYFINTDLGAGKRIANKTLSTQTPTSQVTTYNDYKFWEVDSLNLIGSGREWMGKLFDNTTDYTFKFNFPQIVPSSNITINYRLLGRSTSSSSFTINSNGSIQNVYVNQISLDYNTDFASISAGSYTIPSSTNVTTKITFNKDPSAYTSIGWLDYLTLNAISNLNFSTGQLNFRDIKSVGTGKIAQYLINTTNANAQIWDVTNFGDVERVGYSTNGSVDQYTASADTLHEYIIFDPSSAYRTVLYGSVANQNIHSLSNYEMVIITAPEFLSEANRLADFHRSHDKMSVIVVTPSVIYNEFSSGKQDITAIRNFIKILYNKASSDSDKPRYLLLFGDGSYDNKNRISGNTNFIPTYQSPNSTSPTSSFVSDDYYILMDANEGPMCAGLLDLGLGRLPVKSLDEAKAAVDKIIRYATTCPVANSSNVSSESSPTNFSDWKNTVCFIADDEDNNLHINQADTMAGTVFANYKQFNVNKIYLDAYQQISSSGGNRYPDVTDAINRQVDKGAMIINYTGHGGVVGLAHERITGISDINNWNNYCTMPVFMTATCEFSRWDDPHQVSAGEDVFLNSKGGGAALFTTTRLVYASSNFDLNTEFYKHIFERINGELPRLGDVIRLSKNGANTYPNDRNFSLIGDPAMKLAMPENKVNTLTFNNKVIGINADTIHALSKITITGNITDNNGAILTNFNGVIYPTVYDKPSKLMTLGNDPASIVRSFYMQKNILYKGKASVKNGLFTFTFVVPKDIAYNYGKGKISYYATDNNIDATGYFDNVIIGGSDANASTDNSGPSVKMFMNNEKFVFGGITDENPILIANIADSNGINTVGNGIGHDIVAVLDNNRGSEIVLNDYYQAEMDNYKKGTIRYGFVNLAEGKHALSLKLWDVYNNSTEVNTEFVVSKSQNFTISHLLNYPNPFTTNTNFYFEHNQSCCDLDVLLQIYTITGKLVKTIDRNVISYGYNIEPISWDGRDDYGNKLGRGVYIYRIKVRSNKGEVAERMDKLLILE